MITKKQISKSNNADFKTFEPVPADVYQIQITDVEERETFKYGSTTEKQMQFFFKSEIVDGDEIGKGIVFFTTQSWFDGGKAGAGKASKLYNLMKTVEGAKVADLEEISEVEINGLIGKQLRVTAEITDTNKNKVTGFLAAKKEIPYSPKKEAIDPDLDVPFS